MKSLLSASKIDHREHRIKYNTAERTSKIKIPSINLNLCKLSYEETASLLS
jgi:hypothetical protein